MIREGKIIQPKNDDASKRKGRERARQPYVHDLCRQNIPIFAAKATKYTRKDYEAIPERMRMQKRSLKDVCGDPDLPGIMSCRIFKEKHPELEEKIRQAYYSMPYSMQLKHRIVSPRFIRECNRLYDQKMPVSRIAEALGVSFKSVRRVLLET